MRLAWARHQLALGRKVWSTPAIHTWEAWLTLRWREAALRGAVPAAQLLDAGQERSVWESVLARLAGHAQDEPSLTVHAGALMQAAARLLQAGIEPAGVAHSREEKLLAAALAEVRRECAAKGWLSLRLADAGALDFLRHVPAPLIVGEAALTAVQATLARHCWPGASLLCPQPQAAAASVTLVHAADLERELAACAHWCRAHVERDPDARLLVLSACLEPSLAIQAELLWRALAAGTDAGEPERARWLAVEGGEPLLHQALVADALDGLELAAGAGELETRALLAILRSPYFEWGTAEGVVRLAQWFGELGLGRWQAAALRDALRHAAARIPEAGRLEQWLAAADGQLAGQGGLEATEWARRFAAVLDAASFARPGQLDSRESQRLVRWHALLDEFAGLDAVLPSMGRQEALSRLRRLAAQARHQPASSDAAVTLSAVLADPVAGYDGIWVLGLTESRWPPPPRPDSWVALDVQHRAGWPEAGVGQRRAQALWALSRWQARTGELVLSHPEREGDLIHRPTRLVGQAADWRSIDVPLPGALVGRSAAATDQQLAAIPADALATPLAGGASRLATQQACPFRAQAQWRLGAQPPAPLSGGVPLSLRGRLLHLLLQDFWEHVKDHAGLTALDAPAEQLGLERSWAAAVRATPAARWLPGPVLERERARTLALVSGVLQLERSRAPFVVAAREVPVRWEGSGAQLSLRVDRIDLVGSDAVLLDYKSGASARVALHEGELQPLQLAVYAAALAEQGWAVQAAALLNLQPFEAEFSGVAARQGLLPGRAREVEDWPAAQQQWQQQLVALMAQHLAGDATLTRDRKVCARCHLPALCRRAGAEVAEPGEMEPEND